ncbi:hypothetical protein ABKV19_012626 [Rosa sericea]
MVCIFRRTLFAAAKSRSFWCSASIKVEREEERLKILVEEVAGFLKRESKNKVKVANEFQILGYQVFGP